MKHSRGLSSLFFVTLSVSYRGSGMLHPVALPSLLIFQSVWCLILCPRCTRKACNPANGCGTTSALHISVYFYHTMCFEPKRQTRNETDERTLLHPRHTGSSFWRTFLWLLTPSRTGLSLLVHSSPPTMSFRAILTKR